MGCFGVQIERKPKQTKSSSFCYPESLSTDSTRQLSRYFPSPVSSCGASRRSFEPEALISRALLLRNSASFNLARSEAPVAAPPLTKPPNSHPTVCDGVAEGNAVRRCSSYGYGDERSTVSCLSSSASTFGMGSEHAGLFRLPLPPSASLSSSTSSSNGICSDDASSGSGSSVCAASPGATLPPSVNSKNGTNNSPGLTSPTDVHQSVQGCDPSPLPLPAPPLGSISAVLREFSHEELAGACLNFAQEFFVRDGGLGPVFRTVIKNCGSDSEVSAEVAVTRLRHQGLHNNIKKWRSEVIFLARLSHPHLCKVAGFSGEMCVGPAGKSPIRERERLLVYENPINGGLDGWLYCRRGKAPVDWVTRLKIAMGAAQGLAYLHSARPRQVIYKSFKSINIQLDVNFDAKLSDYGFARTGQGQVVSDLVAASTMCDAYAAPETCASQGPTAESNVWNFGIVLLELLTGRQNMDDFFPREEKDLLQWCRPYLLDSKRLYLIMDPELKGRYVTRTAKTVANLALQCLAKDPVDRPSMHDVAERLSALAGKSNLCDGTVNFGPRIAHHGSVKVFNSRIIANVSRVDLGVSTPRANHGSKLILAKSNSLASVLASPGRVFGRSDDADMSGERVSGLRQRPRLGTLLSSEPNKRESGLYWAGDHRHPSPSRNFHSLFEEMGMQGRRVSGVLKSLSPFSPDSTSPPPLGRTIPPSSRLSFISG